MDKTIELLNSAKNNIPVLETYITEKQTAQKARKGRSVLKDIDSSIASALADLGVVVTDPVPVPGGKDKFIGGVLGRRIGNVQEKVIENKVFGAVDPEQFENTALVRCRFTKELWGRCPQNMRILGCVFEDIKAPQRGEHSRLVLYFNNGHSDDIVDFVLDGNKIINCEADAFAEVKMSGEYAVDNEVIDSKMKQFWRQRFGHRLVLMNNKGLDGMEIGCRGFDHFVQDNPGAIVIWYTGTLPSKFPEWGPMHVKLGGDNMQRTQDSYADGVAVIKNGFYFGDQAKNKYHAVNNYIGPNVGKVIVGISDGVERLTFSPGEYEKLWQMTGSD